MNVRTRFAPSPTGPLHIGGVRTALYNYFFAKKHSGACLLRLEDTDQTRFISESEQYIVESLRWLGIEFDESPEHGGKYVPYRQSERKGIYKKYAFQLIESGNAYYAFDTKEELETMRENLIKSGVPSPQYNANTRESMINSLTLPADEVEKRLKNGDKYVIRVKIPRAREVKVQDIVRNWVSVKSSTLDDKVLFKSDGMPTYHLANVVDDYLMKITHVIRGEEWLPSLPLHMLLYEFLGWTDSAPSFAHLPLLLRPDGKGKLSKRDGDLLGFPVYPTEWKNNTTNEIFSGYREAGFFPEAVTNFLAFLGWNPGDNRELFEMEDLINSFSLEKVGKSGAKFDFEKAKWFNQQYLRKKDKQELANDFSKLAGEKYQIDEKKLPEICELLKERTFSVNEMLKEDYFFVSPKVFDDKFLLKKKAFEKKDLLKAVKDLFFTLEKFGAGAIETALKQSLKRRKYSIRTNIPNPSHGNYWKTRWTISLFNNGNSRKRRFNKKNRFLSSFFEMKRTSTISIECIKVFAYHGVYEEEKVNGGNYEISVSLSYDITPEAKSDDLEKSIDYEKIIALVKRHMGERANLIETVAYKLTGAIVCLNERIEKVTIKIKKNEA